MGLECWRFEYLFD